MLQRTSLWLSLVTRFEAGDIRSPTITFRYRTTSRRQRRRGGSQPDASPRLPGKAQIIPDICDVCHKSEKGYPSIFFCETEFYYLRAKIFYGAYTTANAGSTRGVVAYFAFFSSWFFAFW
ncbi:hypothetical protein FHJ31_24535 [Pseudomonas sp. Fig-3]|uniref:hypothetical protein n=1 Tax=unclassified Pseudomonas TaxID=196821 RepID=UPI001111F36A|nr:MULTISPECIES: hypothetical protein [unclassified Pseudomonas]TNB78792.1 hypothetical protein FHJ31_24535 [Pseudomonas sp. Fig-3]